MFKLKFILSRILPKKFLMLLINIWRNSYVVVHNKIYQIKTKKFDHKLFKIIKYKDLSYYIKLDPANWYVDKHIYAYGIYEKEIYKLMYDNVKKWDICLDIWANIWIYTNFLPKLVWESWKVFGFEPIKKIYEQNLESIRKNGYKNTFLYNYACDFLKQTSTIFVNKENAWASSIYWDSWDEQTINTIVLDDFLHEDRINFVKIDTEWYELSVLKWMKKILNKYHPKIVMELEPEHHKKQNDWRELLDFIKKYYKNILIIEYNKTLNLENKDDIKVFYDLLHSDWVNIFMY